MLTNTGLNINGPNTMTTAPDPGFMWLSDSNPNIAAQFVTFDLGAIYDLDGSRVWNYNEVNILTRGVYQMIVRVSEDNITYRSIGTYTLDKAPDPATAYRDFSQYLPFKVSDVRYVQFDVRSSWGDANYVGLSKVRFFSAPEDEAPVTSGLIMHLDASDTNGDGNPNNEPGFGATVSSWQDKSGQGNHASSLGTPQLHRDVVNGHPAIRFSGDDQYVLPDFSSLTAGEIFIAVRADLYPPQETNLTGLWDMGIGGAQTHYSWVSGHIYDIWGSTVRNDVIDTNIVLDQWNVYNVSSVAGTWTNALNGVTLRTRASNTVTFPASPRLGRSFAGVFLVGDVAEVLMYNRKLTPAERSRVNDYLDRRYDFSGVYNEPDNTPPDTEGILIHYDANSDGQVGNGGVLGTLQDRSGNGLRATAVGTPQWIRNSLGGNAALRFDGSVDEYSLGNLAARFPTGATVFIATSFNDVAYNLFSTANNRDEWWRWNGNGRSYASAFRTPRAENFDAMPSVGEFIFSVESTPNFWRMYQDNRAKAAVAAGYSAGNDYRISAPDNNPDSAKRLSGDISEIIVYDRALSAEKQADVQAYLSAKYRINSAASSIPVTNGRVLHLAADAIPDAADGAVVTSWRDISASGLTATAAGDPNYRDNRINGKPVVEFDGGGDTFSVPLSTSNTMTLISVVRGVNYQSMFRWQPGNWIVYPWGNGNLIQTTNGGTPEGGSINAGLVPDEWNIATAVINTGPANGVKTYRNGVLRGQKTYNAWGNLSPLWIGSINGTGEYMNGEMAELIVYHRALSDDERRAVERYLGDKYGLNGKGPGGLEKSDLELWLRSDRGVVKDVSDFVTEWEDQSGFNRYVYQDAPAQRPDWIQNSVNGLPVLRFNPNSGAGNTVEYFKSDAVWPGGTPGAVGASLVFAAKSNINDTFGYQSIIRYQGGTWLIHPWYNAVIINEDSGTTGVNTGLIPQQWNLSEGLFRANTTNGFQTFNRGSLVAQKTSANVVLGANPLLVGACCGAAASNNESPNADIGEIITYSERLNDARRVLLQNYLSARFATALNANDVYTGDNPAAGNYDWELAGIGRSGNPIDFGDGANPLGAGRHLLGNSAGMIVEEVGFLQDSGDYIIFGHNGVPNDLTNTDLAGSGAQNRWNRIWYLQKADAGGNGGQVDLRFDLSDGNPGGLNSGNLVLLRRAGTSGNFSVIANSPSVLGDQYGFTLNANSLTNAYYTVAEVDTTPPVITLTGGNVTIECSATPYTDPGYIALDNSDGNITGTVSIIGTVNSSQPGNYLLRYNVTDTAGNNAIERTRTVTVQDTQIPVITLIGAASVNVECGATYSDLGASASDACDGDLTSAIVTGGLPVNTTTLGPKQVTYNVMDGTGLPATQVIRTVTVVDATGPVISLNGGDQTLECGVDSYTELGATANDVCAGTVPVTIGGATVNAGAVGVYLVTYNATDGTNPAAQVTRMVTVQDTLGPVIVLNGSANETVVRNQPYVEQGAVATDACEGVVGVTIGGEFVDTATLGMYTVTYDAQDGGARPAAQVIRTVNVVLGNPPVITLLGANPVNIDCGDPYADAGATASDPEDGNVTGDIVAVNPVDAQVAGVYTVTYDVVDTSGNPASQVTRTVNVNDTVAPVVTLIGPANDTIACGTAYTDPGATATDACDDDTALSALIQTTNSPPDTSSPGTVTISYFVTDIAGNTSTVVEREVEVVDNVAPVITRIGAAVINVECGDVYSDPGASVADACDDNTALTSSIVVSGLPIPVGTPGTYPVTYNVSDTSGNAAAPVQRTVVVADTEPPVISLNGAPEIQIIINGNYVEAGASANDSCGGDTPVVIGGDTVDTAVANIYTITYNAQDAAGNDATEVTRRVIVTEGVAPFISEQPQDQTVPYLVDATFSIIAVALGTPVYEWRKDGLPLTNGAKYQGVDTNTLQVIAPENADEGGFLCRVTGEAVFTDTVTAALVVEDPGITLHPESQVVGPGDTVVFSAAAVGSGTLAYAWHFDGQPLVNGGDVSGADTDTLTLLNIAEHVDEGEYYVVVDGGEDPPIESDRAQLTVGNPIIIQHPVSVTIGEGGTAMFNVTASGVAPLLYRWRKDGANLVNNSRYSGVSTTTLTVSGALVSDGGSYSCRVVGQNIVESNSATLSVLGAPILGGVTVLPSSGITPVGGPFALSVTVLSGLEPFLYQWRKDGVPLSDNAHIQGATGPTLTVDSAVVADTGYYDCVVSNVVNAVTSESVFVSAGLTITDNLFARFVEDGTRVEWTIRVDGGAAPPVYQWLKDDGAKALQPLMDIGNISGTGSSTLILNTVEIADSGIYQVTITDGVQVVTTNTAVLTVVASLPGPRGVMLVLLFAGLLAAGSAGLTRRSRRSR